MPLDKRNATMGEMFDNIAPTYDSLNHLLSFNNDKKWRRKAIKKLLQHNPSRILDVATGSGDMILEIAKHGKRAITAIDISANMLTIARQKISHTYPDWEINFIQASAESIPLDTSTFDGACVAFGVRNFENLPKGLTEIHRVLKANGTLVILEFVKPQRKIIRTFLKWYLNHVLPFIGKIISKNKFAYTYLTQSIETFYTTPEFEKLCTDYQFKHIETVSLFYGLVAIFVLKK